MATVLSEENYKFFKDKFPLLKEKELKKMEKHIIKIYSSSTKDIKRLIERGFTEDMKNIIHKEWIIFITKIVPKIKKKVRIKDKKKFIEHLVGLCLFIVLQCLPIDGTIKHILIPIIMEFVPEITEVIYYSIEKTPVLIKLLKKIICCK